MASLNLSRNDSITYLLWIVAALFFVMYAFGWTISDFDAREQLGLGLALFVLGALVP